MKYKPQRMAAIFFLAYFYRPGGGGGAWPPCPPPPPPPDPLLFDGIMGEKNASLFQRICDVQTDLKQGDDELTFSVFDFLIDLCNERS